jgi:hypothetical protein
MRFAMAETPKFSVEKALEKLRSRRCAEIQGRAAH